ncbi:unnamed protein product [Cylindrotheca closterium]|uniref:J domain-containing protein n=1 Tax=Cylindrotheca closterium TaxID=2856 RepID=A0AAD2G0I2_9STRA|nr:unnamed protein product [Cylindrotheca closterium]
MSGDLQGLVSSAFGNNNTCLYKDVLKCSPKATPSALRKAYHKRALLYHPDKQQQQQKDASESSRFQEATLKFQALSATYQLLSDPSQRALYDSTGRIPTSSADNDDPYSGGTCHSKGRRSQKNKDADEWVRFFQSVFQDMMGAGSTFDRNEYCRSQQEREDVLKFYQLCKGDRSKMISCIVQAEDKDCDRWWKEILQPAIKRGDIESYENAPSSMNIIDNDEPQKKKRKKLKRKRPVEKVSKPQVENTSAAEGDGLEDTDDDDDEKEDAVKISSRTMSRREKMEFRVAKKQKEKREREIEIAGIIQSKQWTAGSFGKAAAAKQGKAKRRNQHGLSDSFLSGLQKKFSSSEASSVPISRKKKKGIKRK